MEVAFIDAMKLKEAMGPRVCCKNRKTWVLTPRKGAWGNRDELA